MNRIGAPTNGPLKSSYARRQVNSEAQIAGAWLKLSFCGMLAPCDSIRPKQWAALFCPATHAACR